LVKNPLRSTSLFLWPVWFISAFFYYGVIMLVVELYREEDLGLRCNPDNDYQGNSPIPFLNMSLPLPNITSCSPIPYDSYVEVVINAAAELPGLLITVFLMDHIGRKKNYDIRILYMWCCHVPSFFLSSQSS